MTDQEKPKWIELMRVELSPSHKPTGNTKHFLAGPSGRREFPPFVSLSVAQFEGDVGFYLLYHPKEGSGTDTWHLSLEDALHQAEFEFGVVEGDWTSSSGLE